MIQADSNLSRYQSEIELAQQIQNGLLPKQPPQIVGLDICAINLPAYNVGGDFYDFIPNENESKMPHTYTFVVGDVCGKGLSAAMFMTMLRIVIRTEAGNPDGASPQKIIYRTNNKLYEDFVNTSMLATLFIANYNPLNREFVYANAGHSPVVYCPFDGEARFLTADAPPVGVLQGCSSKNVSIQLRPGDVIVVGTDGLMDAFDPFDIKSAYSRLLQLTRRLSGGSAQEIVNGMVNSLQSFQKAFLMEDDQTVVVFKCV